MKQGRVNKESKTAIEIAIAVLMVCAAYYFLIYSQDPRDLSGDAAGQGLIPSYSVSGIDGRDRIQKHQPRVFSIRINDRTYDSNATIAPRTPIRAYFTHSDSNVVRVRMQHPQNKRLYIDYPLNEEIIIQNHSTYMDRGLRSSSRFMALDRRGNVISETLIIFDPGA